MVSVAAPYGTLRTGDVEDSDVEDSYVEDTTLRTNGDQCGSSE